MSFRNETQYYQYDTLTAQTLLKPRDLAQFDLSLDKLSIRPGFNVAQLLMLWNMCWHRNHVLQAK